MTTEYCEDMTVAAAINALEAIIARKDELLALVSPAGIRSGRWTRQEELGHLCDSALNNMQRFVRLQIAPEWHAPGYAQNDWVRVMDYGALPWPRVVELWEVLQRQMLHLMRTARTECLGNVWVNGENRVTLEWLMVDYVGHHQHHLRSIFH